MGVIEQLLVAYCKGKWCVHVDADEFLVLPLAKGGLTELRHNMEAQKSTALHCRMVDMYSDVSILNSALVVGDNLFESSPYFDPLVNENGILQNYSPRARLFGLYPNLVKYPFFLYTPEVHTIGPGKRAVHQLANVQVHGTSGVLAHFKFQTDLFAKTARAVLENSYWNNSAEYKHLARRFRPDFIPYFHASLQFESCKDFIISDHC